jgi:hypothetical protein
MKLNNQDPRKFIGRTIIFRHQAWLIDGVDGTHVKLSKPGLQEKGLLLLHLFSQCRLYPQPDEIRARFPKLLRALRTVCNLTTLEAENAVFCMITYGQHFMGSEAIAHIGGAGRAIALCWRHRTRVRESFARNAESASTT